MSTHELRSALTGENGGDPNVTVIASQTAYALAESRVDLLKLIEEGIPPREYLPGFGGCLVAGKRHHIAAAAKTGKSLAIALIGGVDLVLAGGVVRILDRENGEEEWVRRLDAVMRARELTDSERQLVGQNLRYHAWPRLKLEWGSDPSYAQAFSGDDLVIFDSSRKFLTSVGLGEDGSDDFSTFTDALIDPLYKAGIATAILDNTGHAEKDRARGTSSKSDLCDLMFALRASRGFNALQAGCLELSVTFARLGDVVGKWELELGAGSFGEWRRQGGSEARRAFHEACVLVLSETQSLGRDALIAAVRGRDLRGKNETWQEWLAQFVGEPVSPIGHAATGYFLAGQMAFERRS